MNIIGINKKTNMTTQPYKRQYRNDMSDAQKQAISQRMKGRTLSQSTKDKISKSMQDYWNSLPYKPTNKDDNTTVL